MHTYILHKSFDLFNKWKLLILAITAWLSFTSNQFFMSRRTIFTFTINRCVCVCNMSLSKYIFIKLSLKCLVHFAANYLFWLSVWCAEICANEMFNERKKKTNKWQHDQYVSYPHQANQIHLKMYSHACRLWHQASIIFNVKKNG